MLYKPILFIFIYLYFNVSSLKDIPGLVLDCNKKMQKGHITDNCNIIPSKNPIIINNYKNNVRPTLKPASSICINCLLCATIAKELHVKFILLHNSYPPKIMLSDEQINATTRIFCNNKFKKFDLREINNKRDLYIPSPITKHVLSDMDGIWPNKLREMCVTFMDLHGPWYIYQKWFQESRNTNFKMVSVLCRSGGLFGHCNNIHEDFTPPSTTFPFIDKTISRYTYH